MKSANMLGRGQATQGMRSFIAAGGIWGAWHQFVGIGSTVFTGYALFLGADESFIAVMVALTYLLAPIQLVSSLVSARIRHKKRFIIGAGVCEMLLRGSLILIPFMVAPRSYLGALVGLVAASLVFAYLLSPIYNTWMVNTIPEDYRARFTSQQTIVRTLAATIFGFAIGQFVDYFPGASRQDAFIYVFAIGTVIGLCGFLPLRTAPYPRETREGETKANLRSLVEPLKDRNFRWATLFFGTWTLALGISGPLYSVFMLEHLKISYTEISIYNAVFMITSIAGYRGWAVLVDRFGSKPVLQMLMLPAALLPLIWIFNTQESHYLVPVALFLGGALFSGIEVSIDPLRYGLLPKGERRTVYLASWSAFVSLLGAIGPLTGGILSRYLRDVHVEIGGMNFAHLQIVFGLSVCARLLPLLLLRLVKDTKGVTTRHVLSQMFQGNLLSYAYNATIFNLATAEERRARAAYALGRSGNPLAIDQLIQALTDASPRVRQSAARALGETGSSLATQRLIRELTDGGSDIRSEAAEALGRLGHSEGIDPLIDALEDEDPRVRISAIRGLAGIKGEEVRELLFWHLSERFDPRTFPTQIDVLSSLGDTRIIKPTLVRLPEFRSLAIRLQLLNSVCRSLGARDSFYRLLSHDEVRRNEELSRLLRRASTFLSRSDLLEPPTRGQLQQLVTAAVQGFESSNSEELMNAILEISGLVRDGLSTSGLPPVNVLSVYLVILAIGDFAASTKGEDLGIAEDIFATVCLHRLAGLVREMGER
jgi:MFS family permease